MPHRSAVLASFYFVCTSLLLLFPAVDAQAQCTLNTQNPSVTICTPANGATVTSPMHLVAGTTSSLKVTSMLVYDNNVLVYKVFANKLDTMLTMAQGKHTIVVKAWVYTGAHFNGQVSIAVGPSSNPAPTIQFSANPATVNSGSSSTLSWTTTNATSVSIQPGLGSVATSGSTSVSPASTTTYTLTATGAGGSASKATTVTVSSSPPLPTAINHVIFMLQENRSFDSYFGMLNPYRKANGWNVGDNGQEFDVDGIDDKLAKFTNKDDEGASFGLFKFTSTCTDDMTSAWLESYGDVNRYNFATTRPILMDGFVHTAEGYAKSGTGFSDFMGKRAMGYYDQGFLNYYYFMASNFALSDRWFSPVASKTIPNRIATLDGGTTEGLVRDPGNDDHFGQRTSETIFQELQNAGVSWKIYYTVTNGACKANDPGDCSSDPNPFPATTLSYFNYSSTVLRKNSTGTCTAPMVPSSKVGDSTNSFCIDTNHLAPLTQYFTDLQNGTLPSFAYIEAGYGRNDEHPGKAQSVTLGQAEVARIVNALMSSSSWKDSVFFFGFDEGGGPFDHVPPVPGHTNDNTDASLNVTTDIRSIAVNPDGFKPCPLAAGNTHCDLHSYGSYADPGYNSTDAPAQQGFAAQLGFRIPNMVISPFTRKHYVSHVPMDHTAIIKFVENRFIGSSAHLTNRDAAQPNLLDFFDFTAVPWATPPAPPAPSTASACHASSL